MKKRIFLCALLCLTILLTFASCGNGMVEDGTGNASNTESMAESMTEKESMSESLPITVESETESESESTTRAIHSNSRRITSDSGTKLNLVVEYSTQKASDGSYTVYCDLLLESYSLSVTARNNTLNYIKVGDETCHFATDAINYDGNAKTEFYLGSYTFNVDGNTSEVPLKAVWTFNGVYSGTSISTLEIDTTIVLLEEK